MPEFFKKIGIYTMQDTTTPLRGMELQEEEA